MPALDPERRNAPRHEIPLPLSVRASEGAEHDTVVRDLSEAGIRFDVPAAVDEGALLTVRFPLEDDTFRLNAAVAWCQPVPAPGSYRVGAYFLRAPLSFRLKLARQVEQIRELRKELVLIRGDEVTPEEAAREWVEFVSGKFPDLYEREPTQRS